jgi:hypothetical protein
MNIVIFQRESLSASLLSDAFTFVIVSGLILLSHHMGGGVWEFLTVSMMVLWLGMRLPMERRATATLASKAQAIEWAQGLEADQ